MNSRRPTTDVAVDGAASTRTASAELVVHTDNRDVHGQLPTVHRRVSIAAVSSVTRWGLRAAIEEIPELSVVSEHRLVLDLVEFLSQDPYPTDVVVLGGSTLGHAGELTFLADRVPVIALQDEERYSAESLVRAGARGVLGADLARDTLRFAVHGVCSGAVVLPPALLDEILNSPADAAPSHPDLDGLSRRERDVLACVLQGWTNRRIGEHLFIGEGTVKGYVSSILTKLDLPNRTAVMAAAQDWSLPVPQQSPTRTPSGKRTTQQPKPRT